MNEQTPLSYKQPLLPFFLMVVVVCATFHISTPVTLKKEFIYANNNR